MIIHAYFLQSIQYIFICILQYIQLHTSSKNAKIQISMVQKSNTNLQQFFANEAIETIKILFQLNIQKYYLIVVVKNNQMRKRSGALHSDDYQQYLQLSQRSDSKIGIFYNENQNRSNNKSYHNKLKSEAKSVNKPSLNNFDFDRSAIPILQQARIVPQKISTIHMMIIFEQNRQTEEMIKRYFEIESTPYNQDFRNNDMSQRKNRNVDLFIKNRQINENEQIVYKIWLNFAPSLPIFQVYYNHIENFVVIQNELNNLNQISIRQRIFSCRQKKNTFYQFLPYQNISQLHSTLNEFYEKGRQALSQNFNFTENNLPTQYNT